MIRSSLLRLAPPRDYARAVSRHDLSSSSPNSTPAPAKSAPESSMMPWNGWFSSFLASKLGPERYDSLRRLILYRPDDNTGMEQMPRPNTKLSLSDQDPELVHKFRQPSPGSQPPVSLDRDTDPSFGNAADDPYNVSYYKRDTGRRYTSDPASSHRDIEAIKLALLPSDDPRVQEAKEEFNKGPGSSVGNKGMFATGKTTYDPSGLRATMSTSWEATEKSLDENMPNHLPTPVWAKSVESENEVYKWYVERDLPVPMGGVGFGTVPTRARIARW
jgi:hypothetical protein